MPFRFRLETVLKVKKENEQLALKELTKVELMLRDVEKKVQSIQKEMGETEERIQNGLSDVRDLSSHHSYLKRLGKDLAFSQDEWLKTKNLLEKKRRALQEAIKERKSLETLRDKQKLEWEQGERQRERQELDEIATVRHVRKGMIP